MRLEQRAEQAEVLLETNEQNKRQVAQTQTQLQQAITRTNAASEKVNLCNARLQQAINAKIAAQNRAQESDEPVSSSFDAAISQARSELLEATRELRDAAIERSMAENAFNAARESLSESAQTLAGVATSLQFFSERYGVEMNKTLQLMSLPHEEFSSALLQTLGERKEMLDDIRRRIAESLGIPMVDIPTPGSQGSGHGVLAKILTKSGTNTLRKMSYGSGGDNDSTSRYEDYLSSYRRIIGNHSIEDDLRAINPNFSYTDYNSVWNINCQRCVMAYEARRRGYDVEALPAPNGPDFLPIMRHPDGWPTVFKDPVLVDCSANSGTAAKLNVEDQMEQWGDNCRAIVRVRLKPEWGGSGHVFIAERVNGVTRFIDPQSNLVDASDLFLGAKGEGLFCMRTDNLEFSDKIKLCCKNVGDAP